MSSRPSRLGDLLQVDLMTPEQKAAQLQRVEEAEAVLAAFKAELVVGLAADRPAERGPAARAGGGGVGGVGGRSCWTRTCRSSSPTSWPWS